MGRGLGREQSVRQFGCSYSVFGLVLVLRFALCLRVL